MLISDELQINTFGMLQSEKPKKPWHLVGIEEVDDGMIAADDWWMLWLVVDWSCASSISKLGNVVLMRLTSVGVSRSALVDGDDGVDSDVSWWVWVDDEVWWLLRNDGDFPLVWIDAAAWWVECWLSFFLDDSASLVCWSVLVVLVLSSVLCNSVFWCCVIVVDDDSEDWFIDSDWLISINSEPIRAFSIVLYIS